MNGPDPGARVIAVSVGGIRTIDADGRKVRTGIFKAPVTGRVAVGTLGLEGDRQADQRVHGGERKAVYAYPAEHYEFWRRELPGIDLPHGMFGENLTIEGVLESQVRPGDRFRAGTAELTVTGPRLPCFKLAAKFGRRDMIARFMRSGRTGFYFAVDRQGEVGAGDLLERIAPAASGPTIAEIVQDRAARSRPSS